MHSLSVVCCLSETRVPACFAQFRIQWAFRKLCNHRNTTSWMQRFWSVSRRSSGSVGWLGLLGHGVRWRLRQPRCSCRLQHSRIWVFSYFTCAL